MVSLIQLLFSGKKLQSLQGSTVLFIKCDGSCFGINKNDALRLVPLKLIFDLKTNLSARKRGNPVRRTMSEKIWLPFKKFAIIISILFNG